MKITVVVTTYVCPYDQVVRGVHIFTNVDAAKSFINDASQQWWLDNEGERCMVEYPDTEPYEPINELGYNHARYELWQGEQVFHAMLDHASYAALHEAHYKREFDDKSIERPGYLQVSYINGNKPE